MSNGSVIIQWRRSAALLLGMLLLTACGSLHRPRSVQEEQPIQAYRPPDAYATQIYEVLLGELAGQSGDIEESMHSYLQAASTSTDPHVAQRALQIALYAHDDRSAQQAAERWLALQPDSLEPRQALSLLYLRSGRINDSVAQFDYLIAKTANGNAAQLYVQIAMLLSRETDKAAALKVMQGLVDKHADEPYAQLSLSQLAVLTQNLDVAERAASRALALKPNWSDALILRARVQAERGDLNAALAGMRKVLAKHPKNSQLRMSYARMLVQAKQFNAARDQFRRVARAAPNDADVQYALGLLALDANQAADAKGYFKRLLELGKHEDEARYYLGRIAEDGRLYPEALAWYGKVEQGEYLLDAQLRIAVLTAKRGDIEAARARLHDMAKQNPTLAGRITLVEGELLIDAQRFNDAMTLYGQALQNDPDNNDLLYARALLAERLDKVDILERDLRAILKREPNNALALNALGYTLADRALHLDEALGLIKRALVQLPNDPAVLDSMGWVQFRLGHSGEALQYLRRAYALNDDAEIAAHLIEVLWDSGDKSAARKLGRQALKANPDNKALRNVLHRITP